MRDVPAEILGVPCSAGYSEMVSTAAADLAGLQEFYACREAVT
jgi:hypothetical protein